MASRVHLYTDLSTAGRLCLAAKPLTLADLHYCPTLPYDQALIDSSALEERRGGQGAGRVTGLQGERAEGGQGSAVSSGQGH